MTPCPMSSGQGSGRKKRHPAYMGKVIAQLSDGRTPGVCKHCGKQHAPPWDSWASGNGCDSGDSIPIQRFAPLPPELRPVIIGDITEPMSDDEMPDCCKDVLEALTQDNLAAHLVIAAGNMPKLYRANMDKPDGTGGCPENGTILCLECCGTWAPELLARAVTHAERGACKLGSPEREHRQVRFRPENIRLPVPKFEFKPDGTA